MILSRRDLMAGAGASLAAGSALAQTRPPPAAASRGVFAQVLVNGRPVQGILDSGATAHAIDAGLARDLGLKSTSRRVTTLGVGGLSRGHYSEPANLKVGGQTLPRSTLAVLDLSEISQRIGEPVHFLLGRPLFNSMIVEIDFRSRAVEIHPRRDFRPPAADEIKLSALMGLMTAPVRVGGEVVYAAVDTGTMAALMVSPRAAERAGLLADDAKVSTTLLGGLAGVSEARITSAATLELGKASFRDVPVRIAPRPVGPEAVLGLELLSRFRIWLDFGYQRMWMRPEGLQRPFQHDLLGLFGDATAQGLKVTFVARGSPAVARGSPAQTAGLKAGDVIVRINGRPSIDVDVGIVRPEPGFRMTFVLAGGDEKAAVLARYY